MRTALWVPGRPSAGVVDGVMSEMCGRPGVSQIECRDQDLAE